MVSTDLLAPLQRDKEEAGETLKHLQRDMWKSLEVKGTHVKLTKIPELVESRGPLQELPALFNTVRPPVGQRQRQQQQQKQQQPPNRNYTEARTGCWDIEWAPEAKESPASRLHLNLVLVRLEQHGLACGHGD